MHLLLESGIDTNDHYTDKASGLGGIQIELHINDRLYLLNHYKVYMPIHWLVWVVVSDYMPKNAKSEIVKGHQ